jgi:hypothetical protein
MGTGTEVRLMRRGHLPLGEGFSGVLDTDVHSLHVTRYDDEERWIVDAVWVRENSYPLFANGEGSRCTALRAVVDEDAIRLLDEAACVLSGGC